MQTISAGNRYPSGRRRGRRAAHGGNPGTAFRRFCDNWAKIKDVGEDPVLASEIGRMYAYGYLTERQAEAAKLYAVITARYERFNGETRRTPMSPAYERGSGRGKEDEIERHQRSPEGMRAYIGRARRTKKQYQRLQKHIPAVGRAREVVEEVCLYDRAIPAAHHADFCAIMNKIAAEFGITEGEPVDALRSFALKEGTREALTHNEKRCAAAVEALDSWFSGQKVAVTGYRIMEASKTECGVEAFGLGADAAPVRHAVLISRGRALAAHLNSLLDKAAAAKGWARK